MNLFKSLWGGSKKGKDDATTKRQHSTANTGSSTLVKTPEVQRKATITDANTVANAFNSGDPQQISGLMKKHVVNFYGSSKTTGMRDFRVEEVTGQNMIRRSSSGSLHELKKFQLIDTAIGSENKGGPTARLGYFPMTKKQDAWVDSSNGSTPQIKRDQIQYTPTSTGVSVTGALSGCSIARKSDGKITHVQPFGLPTGTKLRLRRDS